ncbi:MAG: asparagine synthase (glutamine-hydrolyzing) [Sphingobacteriales bacterium]|nr:asparagine synthase (glutamine-hydrolyzing) [Sphingobacteriales bacterium]MBI3718148.1 asparagine synthase (glutamine-hydrolyzing) [Sphingobacteriales bacterium]
MCGIAGIIQSGPVSDISKMSNTLQSMTNAIAHRGPDGEGYWINEAAKVGFGHRRLSIIDLSDAAAQPMHYLDRYTIIYNGELYNYIEIRATLQQKGYSFRTQSDTEVILAAYDCWKEKCLDEFDGMFAFALLDEKEQLLFAARDRFGEKPFYYFKNDEQFLFASEMKALWAAGVIKEKNNTFLLYYLCDGQMMNPHNPSETFYENIFSLSTASYLKYDLNKNKFTIDRWWDLDKESSINISEKKATEKIYHLLSTSVKRRLRSDVEVGNSLSGGIDSSTILSLIYQQSNKPKTFSAIFPGFEKDESVFIKEVLSQYPSTSFTITPSADDLSNDLEKFLYYHDQPVQSASVYLQYKIYALAKQHGIKVILDGQGADEILGGYTKYLHWYLQELVAKGKFKLAGAERKLLQSNYPFLQWGWKNKVAAFTPYLTANQLQKKVFRSIGNQPDIDPDFSYHSFSKEYVYKPPVSKLNDILYYDAIQNTLPELLRYADRNSMAHGVEVRLPFLNHKLVQFIFSLPSSFKINNGFTKWIVRKTMEPYLSPAIIWRKDKIGYEPPQQQWMQQNSVREQIQEARRKLVNAEILKQTVLNKPVVAKAAHEADNYDWRYLCAASML